MLVVLLGCVALLSLASTALAGEDTGKIEGTVTEYTLSEDFVPLENIDVTVYEAGGSELPVGFAITRAGGKYMVEGLAGGSYEVEFSPGFESGLNYVTQFYKDRLSLATAEPVRVVEGEATEGIDAELRIGGRIEGTVTAACECELLLPLNNIEVTAYEAGGGGLPVGYATTGAGGKYAIVGLASGSYTVMFSPGFESGLNFVTQYYREASSLATAQRVEVTQGSATEGIDAELQRGGEIEGTVTDASTHAPLSNAEVVVLGAGEMVDGVAFTNTSGQYTIAGLATGAYEIRFASSHYIVQYYDGQSSIASANLVAVVQGSAASGIDAALVPKAPVNTAAPVALGTPAAGQTLSCATGSWTGSPTPAFTYTWLRDGVAIAGATASTYVVQAADVGNGLTCKVTGTNKSGSAAAISNTLIVPVPPAAPPPKPAVKLLSTRLGVFGGVVRVPLACAAASCTGTVELTERTVVKRRRGRRTIAGEKTLILGRGSYSLMAGHSATVVVHLTATGRRVLAGGHRERRVSATVVVYVTGATMVQRSVIVRPPLVGSETLTEHKRRH